MSLSGYLAMCTPFCSVEAFQANEAFKKLEKVSNFEEDMMRHDKCLGLSLEVGLPSDYFYQISVFPLSQAYYGPGPVKWGTAADVAQVEKWLNGTLTSNNV